MSGASLQIENARERAVVRVADALLFPLRWMPRRRASGIHRILLLRLERIGDLLMTLDAIDDVRRLWPDATIDLAVGSWNAPLASLVPDIARVHIVDVPWLSRGERETSLAALLRAAWSWRRESYDLVVNFEPDIRSNLLAWLSGARTRAGYASGGGGAFLSETGVYDPTTHVANNARRLVAHAAARQVPEATGPTARPRLIVPAAAAAAAAARFTSAARPLIGVHASGGRESKQWHLDRFAAVARALARDTAGTIVLTGGPSDAAMVDVVRAALAGTPVVSVAGTLDLPEMAAVLAHLDLLVTSDTGPMHLAAAVGTPVVALFGPSDPARYGPRAPRERIVRVDLPCSPCGQVRRPPERCRGHVPDCMDGITTDVVIAHALDLLNTQKTTPS